jgi:hypothetical protein
MNSKDHHHTGSVQNSTKANIHHSKKSSDFVLDSLGNSQMNRLQLPMNKTQNITINSHSNNSPTLNKRGVAPSTGYNDVSSPQQMRTLGQMESSKINNTSYSKIGDSNTLMNDDQQYLESSVAYKNEDNSNITSERDNQPEDARVRAMNSDLIFTEQPEPRHAVMRCHFDNDMNNKISSFKSVRKAEKHLNESQAHNASTKSQNA